MDLYNENKKFEHQMKDDIFIKYSLCSVVASVVCKQGLKQQFHVIDSRERLKVISNT
jgi:hypothetical protein